ncbi:GFA family protein [Pendulispora brunnea]|uniref:GFA family protein n=1 Tax=Pendulispora brunnea TaxID=2905690 RepID=A0ABZ2KAE7_9BACT
MKGSCLCGTVAFESDGPAADFVLDHCSRCRKSTGSAFFAELVVPLAGFQWVRGESAIRVYEAPVRETPPGYQRAFCTQCGSPVPMIHSAHGLVSIPAGSLDDDPGVRPQRHIFVDAKAPWFSIEDSLPKFGRK